MAAYYIANATKNFFIRVNKTLVRLYAHFFDGFQSRNFLVFFLFPITYSYLLMTIITLEVLNDITFSDITKKMKFFIKDFYGKCDQCEGYRILI